MHPFSCQVGGEGIDTYNFVSAHFDPHNIGTLFGLTLSGDILVFSTTGSSLRTEPYECKLVRKVIISSSEMRDIRPIKNGLLLQSSDGSFEHYNISSSG